MADAKTTHAPCKPTEALEPPAVQPCYEGMDDTAEYAQTLLLQDAIAKATRSAS